MKYVNPKCHIRDAARKNPDKAAVISASGAVSYRALNGLLGVLARNLEEAGVGDGDTVAIAFPNSLEFVVAFYALLQANAIVFPVSPKLAGAELAQVLATAKVRHLMLPRDGQQRAAPAKNAGVETLMHLQAAVDSISVERTVLNNPRKHPARPRSRRAKFPFMVRQYSSGSTGEPKHLLKTTRNMWHDAWHFSAGLGLTGDDVFLGIAPFYHAYGILNVTASLYLGASLVVVENFLPHKVLERIAKDRPTVCLATPSMLELLADCYLEKVPVLDSLRCCVTATAPLRKAVYDKFHRRFGVPVFQHYGSSETGAISIYRVTDCSDETLVGMPMPGVSVQVFDENSRRLGKGRVGRVGIKSPSACDRYLNNPEASAKTFRAGYVFPGDRGYLEDSGAVHIVGRDNVINVGGLKVDALEVERVLNSHPQVAESLVYAATDGKPPLLRAAVVPREGGLTAAGMLAHCRAHLSDYKVPKAIHLVDKLPRNEHGKIVRKAIEEHVRLTCRH